MTDRISGLTVTLAPNIREDDAGAIMSAILQLKGVYSVSPHVADIGHHLAVTQARIALEERLLNALRADDDH